MRRQEIRFGRMGRGVVVYGLDANKQRIRTTEPAKERAENELSERIERYHVRRMRNETSR